MVCAVDGPWLTSLDLHPEALLGQRLLELPIPGADRLARHIASDTGDEAPEPASFGPWALDAERALALTLQPLPLLPSGRHRQWLLQVEDHSALMKLHRRWARELHDEMMQLLAAAYMEVDFGGEQIPEALRREVLEILDETLQSARALEREILTALPPRQPEEI